MDANEAVQKALKVVETVKDPGLRAVAFGSLLSHFLGSASSPGTTKAGARPLKDEGAPKARKSTTGSSGPKARLEALREEDFFSTPRTMQQILGALAERGHHMQHPDLTWPLQQMVKDRSLRRKKESVGNKLMWHYANW
jgi:hypothetical protein